MKRKTTNQSSIRAPARDDARPLLERLLRCVVQAKAPPDITVSNGANGVVLEKYRYT
jgi:hypothetical protein